MKVYVLLEYDTIDKTNSIIGVFSSAEESIEYINNNYENVNVDKSFLSKYAYAVGDCGQSTILTVIIEELDNPDYDTE